MSASRSTATEAIFFASSSKQMDSPKMRQGEQRSEFYDFVAFYLAAGCRVPHVD